MSEVGRVAAFKRELIYVREQLRNKDNTKPSDDRCTCISNLTGLGATIRSLNFYIKVGLFSS